MLARASDPHHISQIGQLQACFQPSSYRLKYCKLWRRGIHSTTAANSLPIFLVRLAAKRSSRSFNRSTRFSSYPQPISLTDAIGTLHDAHRAVDPMILWARYVVALSLRSHGSGAPACAAAPFRRDYIAPWRSWQSYSQRRRSLLVFSPTVSILLYTLVSHLVRRRFAAS